MSSTGKTLSPQLMFHNAASNIICQVLFGTRYEYDDEFIKVIVQCFTENAKIANGPWAMVSQNVFLPSNLAQKYQQDEEPAATLCEAVLSLSRALS